MDFAGTFQVLLSIFTFTCVKDIVEGFQYDYITCGSTLKMFNPYHNVRLHSHDVKYGSGSGQQSVTAVDSSDDHNSYWQVKAKTGTQCIRGQPIKCSQTVRLMHIATKRNLHSHHFQSPLSHNLEVSAFGEEGEGDEGDHWVVVCNGQFWNRKEKFRLKNVVTEYYLHVTGDTFGRPISGQREVSAYPSPNDLNYWQAMEGIFVTPSEDPKGTYRQETQHMHERHTELYYLHVTGDTFGRPISGQREVSGYPSPNDLNYWQAMEGIFVTPSEDPKGTYRQETQHMHESYLHVTGDTFGRPISGQREVSGYPSPNDLNYWQAMEGIFVTPSEDPKGTYRQETQHMHDRHTDLYYLHVTGDTFGRPISGQREVSGYPSPNDLNYWQAMEGIFVTPSEDPKGTYRQETQHMHERHTDLYYLHVTGDTFGRPISGQREVSGYPSPNDLNYWQAMEGIFVTPSEDPKGTYRPEAPHKQPIHDEF